MRRKKIIRICAFIISLSGLVILVSAIYPIVEYEIESSQRYPALLSPIVKSVQGNPSPEKIDYTRASNWFSTKKDFTSSNILYYTLTIPKLEIKDASVAIGGEDLSESLIQYPGTALPGKVGNTVVFGHSILPIFYDPKRYLAIFSTLNTLDMGDEIIIDYDGISYKYLVEEMFEVKPEDIEVLDQNANDSYLSLITCTPPGHPDKPKRLIVRAKIAPFNSANALKN